MAHVHWSLRYHSRQADSYEEVTLPDSDATENPMYSTDAVWQGANSDIGDASNVRTLEMSKSSMSTETSPDEDEDEDDEHARLIQLEVSFLKDCS